MCRPAAARRDDRGEVLPVAILFVGVLLTILIGVHVVMVSLARTAVQNAADEAVTAAQGAGPGQREDVGVQAAVAALRAASSSVSQIADQPPTVTPEEDQGVVRAEVSGAIHSPLLHRRVVVIAQACGPLDDVMPADLTGAEAWQC